MKNKFQDNKFFKLVLPAVIVAGFALMVAGVVFAQSQLPGQPLTSNSGNNLRPVWSPDGSQIAYFSDSEGSYDIWLMNSDGTNKRQLTEGPADDRRPSWSWNGEWITFDSDVEGSRDVWVVLAAGGDPIQITSGPADDNFPAFSPDGTQIAYFSYQGGILDIWIVDVGDALTGGSPQDPTRITSSLADETNGQCTYACHVPAWSPDGEKIAYTGSNHTEIFLIGADGTNLEELHFDEAHMHFPSWTPDGKLIMLSEHKNKDNEPVNDVWISTADGSNAVILYPGIPHGGPFYWNPTDIETIAFHSPRAGKFDLYTTNLTGDIVINESVVDIAATTEPEPEAPTQTAPAPAEDANLQASDTAVDETPASRSPLSTVILWGAGIILLLGITVIVYVLRKGQ